MKFAAILCVSVCSLLSVASAPVKEPKTDKELLQGTWSLIKIEVDGNELKELPKLTLIFKDDKVTVTREGVKDKHGPFKLDAEKKVKEIDLTTTEDNQTVLCIYKLDGDKLTMCIADAPGSARPTEFKSGPRILLVDLKRVKTE